MDPDLLMQLLGMGGMGMTPPSTVDPRMLDPVGAMTMPPPAPPQPVMVPGMGAGGGVPQPPMAPPMPRPPEPYMSELPAMSGMGAGGTLPTAPSAPSMVAPGMGAGGMLPTSPTPPQAAGPMSLGAALEPAPAGVPIPRPRPAEAGAGAAPASGGSDALLKTLRGVTAPAASTPQKVTTPHPPQIAKIQGGALADLLASLGIGPQQALPGLKLPSTLGQALGGR